MSDKEQTDSESDDDMETSVNIQENSDSEATESESDEDAKNIQSFVDCLSKIEQNKYNYDSYVELLGLAHETGDLEKIRQSYELFASVFPLAPDHWLKWLRLELNISTSAPEIKRVSLLFQRALSDYYSSEVALELANLALKSPKSDDIWEQLLSTYTLHCTQGRSIFEAYRLYLSKQDNAQSDEYYQKLIEAYERELAIPLKDMEETYIELKLLCEKQKKDELINWPRIDQAYNKAKEQLQKILPFEKKLADLDAKSHQNRAAIYFEYIEYGRQFLNDQIIQVLYERMVTDCCLNVSCWLSYIKYIQSRDGHQAPQINGVERPLVFSQTEWDIINRAIRNCTWTSSVYIEKMRIAERMELNKNEVKGVLEFALAAGFPTAEQYVCIWLEYLSYLRRNTTFTCEKECEILRATFTMAWDLLGRQFGVLADCECEILQYWGRLEYGPLNDLAKGKQLWTTVMESADNSTKSALWIEFAHLEMKKGPDGARKVFRKALATKVVDNISVIASAWIRFERCNGTLDQLKLCQELCEERLATTMYKAKPQLVTKGKNLKRKATRTEPDKPDAGEFRKRKATRTEPDKPDAGEFRKPITKKITNSIANSTESKRLKLENLVESHGQEVDTSKDNVTIFLSNLDYSVTNQDITEAFPEFNIAHVNIIKAANGTSRGFGYVQLQTAADVEKSLTFDRRLIKGRPTFISSVLRDKEKRSKFKYSESVEKTKLFIKGLSFDATKSDLEDLFGVFGPLKDVRLVYQKSGAPKGLAYIEFEKESSASNAVLKMNDFEFKNHKMSVAISNPPPRVNKTKTETIGLGQGRRNALPRGEAKPRLSFIPRSVQKNVLDLSTSALTIEKPKSNEDFRKLLNK